jgi:hypothetical protein
MFEAMIVLSVRAIGLMVVNYQKSWRTKGIANGGDNSIQQIFLTVDTKSNGPNLYNSYLLAIYCRINSKL